MAIDREQQNFEGNQRVDLPDFRKIFSDSLKDLRLYTQALIDQDARRIIKEYVESGSTGLTFKILTDRNRAFMDFNAEWVMKTPDAGGSTIDLTLADDTTNFIEVKVFIENDDQQTRAFFDTDIGLTGEEFFDDVNVRTRIDELVEVNQVGFSPGSVPLFQVQTAAGAITSIVKKDDLLWRPRLFDLSATATRAELFKNIFDLRSFIDFVGSITSEMKGKAPNSNVNQLTEDKTWSNLRLLREYQSIFFTGNPTAPIISFEKPTADTLTWDSTIRIEIAGRPAPGTLAADSQILLDGECLFVKIPEPFTGLPEIQFLKFSSDQGDTGNYQLEFNGNTTPNQPAGTTAGTLDTAFNALASVTAAGGAVITGDELQGFTIIFNNVGPRVEVIIPFNNVEISLSSTPVTITPSTIQEGAAAASQALTKQVALLSAVPINPLDPAFDPTIIVLFFRRGNTIYGMMDIPELESGQEATLGKYMSDQNLLLIGGSTNPITEITTDPEYALRGAPQRTIDDTQKMLDAMSSMDIEIDKFHGQFRMTPHESITFKARITGADRTLKDGVVFSQELNSLIVDADSRIIDFAAGLIRNQADDTTLDTFTPASITVSNYRWFGIAIIPDVEAADGRLTTKILITPSDDEDAVQADAKKPIMVGQKKTGGILLFNNAGTLEVIEIRQLGAGAGSGVSGDIKATFIDPIDSVFPTGSSVTFDGVSGANKDLILFTNLSSGNNRIYELNGVGTAISFTAVRAFNGEFDPVLGSSVRIQKGDSFASQLAVFNGVDFLVNDIARFFDGVSGDFWELSSIKTTTLADNSVGSIFEVNVTGSENFVINYSIVRGANKETGQIFVTSDGTTVSVARSEATIGDAGVEFSGDVVTGDLRLRFATTATGSAATMKYFVHRWSNAPGGPTGIPNYSGVAGSTVAAAGSPQEIQFHGSGGNLDADSKFKWDTAEGAMNLNGLVRTSLIGPITLNDNQAAPLSIINYLGSSFKSAIVEYSLERAGEFRTGRIIVANDATTKVALSDDSVETGVTGITFSASISGGVVNINYTSTSTGSAGAFKYSIKKWDN